MAFISKDTWEILNLESINDLYPMKRDAIECDDLIAPTIRLLNMNGFETIYSCSAHMYNSYTEVYSDYVTNLEYRKHSESIIMSGHRIWNSPNGDIGEYKYFVKQKLTNWYIGFPEKNELYNHQEEFIKLGVVCEDHDYFVAMDKEPKHGFNLRKIFNIPEDYHRMKNIVEFNEKIYNLFQSIIKEIKKDDYLI